MAISESLQHPPDHSPPKRTVSPETEAAIRKGIQDVLAGRTKPWAEVKRDLGLE